jgi:hypothetical protein
VTGVRHREEELRRAFFSARFVRVLDSLGYARFKNWRLYGEEALAGSEAVLWLASESLTLEHRGEALARYEVGSRPPPGGSGRWVGRGSSRPQSRARSKGSSPSTTSGRAGGSRR